MLFSFSDLFFGLKTGVDKRNETRFIDAQCHQGIFYFNSSPENQLIALMQHIYIFTQHP